MRRRLGCWVVMAVVAAGCAARVSNGPTASDQTDVWFMQHMVPHLLQTNSIIHLTGDRITHPKLARLADTVNKQGQAHLQRLQEWLSSRGLAPYDPQQQRTGTPKETDLERLSQIRGAKFDLLFLKVMTARHRAGSKLAAAEVRDGTVPEVRQLAQQQLSELQAQIRQMTSWRRAWSKAKVNRRDGQDPSFR